MNDNEKVKLKGLKKTIGELRIYKSDFKKNFRSILEQLDIPLDLWNDVDEIIIKNIPFENIEFFSKWQSWG